MREEKDNAVNRDYASSFHWYFQRLAMYVDIGFDTPLRFSGFVFFAYTEVKWKYF